MAEYYGDFAEDETLYIPFNTFDSNDPSASVTITNLADADIKVHKDGSTTDIVTDGATIVIDFDSITGNHLITIDTSAHADYSTGSDYMVRIEGTTVDAATINAWVGSFSIENRYKHGVAQTVDNNVLAAGATGFAAIDTVVDEILVDTAAMQPLVAKIPLSDGTISWNSTALASINAECDTALADYDGPTNAEMIARTLVAASYFDPTADAVASVTLVATLTTYTGNTPQTGDSFARIGSAGAGLTNINLPNQTMDITGDITGNLSGSVGSVTGGATSTAQTTAQNDLDIITGATGVNLLTATQASIDAIEVDTSTTLPGLIDDLAVKKNATFSNFEFLMVLTSDGRTPATGLTVTGQRSINGASFTNVTGTIAEVSNGIYQFDAVAADTNGDVITWRFSSATADDTFVTFKTVQ